MADFHGGKRLQVYLWEFHAQFTQHFDVVAERVVRVESTYDVQFAGSASNRFGGFPPNSVVVPVVGGGTVLLDFRECAELAVQHAHVGVVDLAVVHPIHGLAVPAFLFGIRAGAEFVERGV